MSKSQGDAGGETVRVLGGASPDDWSAALEGVICVVHLAGAAHARQTPDALTAANVGMTLALVRAAERNGVRRLVFVSSVKAVGEDSGDTTWTEDTPAAPTTPYGRSKLDAERACLDARGLDVVILRPPLVLSPDARANFAALLRIAALPVPLPLGSLTNRRSVISRDSLVDRLVRAAVPDGPTGVYFVTDEPALSTSEIVAAMRCGFGRNPGLWPAIAPNLRTGALQQIYGSLAVSDRAFHRAFSGTPVRDAKTVVESVARKWRLQRSRVRGST